jgi:hypothetical protein
MQGRVDLEKLQPGVLVLQSYELDVARVARSVDDVAGQLRFEELEAVAQRSSSFHERRVELVERRRCEVDAVAGARSGWVVIGHGVLPDEMAHEWHGARWARSVECTHRDARREIPLNHRAATRVDVTAFR